MTFAVEGEFVSDVASSRVLLPLSAVEVVEPEVITTPAEQPGEWQ